MHMRILERKIQVYQASENSTEVNEWTLIMWRGVLGCKGHRL